MTKRQDTQPRLPPGALSASEINTLTDHLRAHALAINELAQSNASGTATAVPTTGTHVAGEYIGNESRTELGVVGAKYVLMGWLCTVGGTPGTWVEDRSLTGG